MLLTQTAITASSVVTAYGSQRGLWTKRVPGSAVAQIVGTFNDLHPGRRLRPSHSPSGWAHHYRRWGDNRIVPIPMSRGIPFRGDRFGGPFYAAANLSATGV